MKFKVYTDDENFEINAKCYLLENEHLHFYDENNKLIASFKEWGGVISEVTEYDEESKENLTTCPAFNKEQIAYLMRIYMERE